MRLFCMAVLTLALSSCMARMATPTSTVAMQKIRMATQVQPTAMQTPTLEPVRMAAHPARTCGTVNVRACASRSCRRLDTLADGTAVTVINSAPSGWALIEYNGDYRGFIYGKWICR